MVSNLLIRAGIDGSNRLGLGDMMMVTSAVRDLKRDYPDRYKINVYTAHMGIWDNNPHLSPPFQGQPHIEVRIGPMIATRQSHNSGRHFVNAFRESLEWHLGIPIKQGPIRPEIFLSDQEKNAPPPIQGLYWVLMMRGAANKFTSKNWPDERWQELVEAMPWITFVQVGVPGTAGPALKGDNVIDYVGRTSNLRDLFKLYYHADGGVGLISSGMHIAAAFLKPYVVLAGAREPVTWEMYPWHRFIHYQGSMKCPRLNALRQRTSAWQQGEEFTRACWRDSVEACGQRMPAGHAKCMDMIKTHHVVDAIESYYEGGLLERPKEKEVAYIAPERPVFRMVAGCRHYLGGERSVCKIMNMMERQGYKVEFVAKPGSKLHPDFQKNMGGAELTNKLTSPCAILMLYANDWVYEFNKDFYKTFEKIQADRKLMVLNYRLGKGGQEPWTKDWDAYFFLNDSLRKQFLERIPDATTFALAPPVELEPFLALKPTYKQRLHFVKHSSQGDQKHPEETAQIIEQIRAKHSPETQFSFMPPPTFLTTNNVNMYRWDEMPVTDFLMLGNCFFYPLKVKFNDMGPRAIVEAMAAGLPVMADNRGGARDRVTDETGWLCDNFDEYADKIAGVTIETLTQKGQAAKERAREKFDPQKWVEAITK